MRRSYIGVAAPRGASRWYATGLALTVVAAARLIEFNVINDFNYQPACGTANARVALASRARTWEVALFADTLTDKHYAYTGGTIGTPLSPVPTIAWNIPGTRRTAGLEGTYRWNPAH